MKLLALLFIIPTLGFTSEVNIQTERNYDEAINKIAHGYNSSISQIDSKSLVDAVEDLLIDFEYGVDRETLLMALESNSSWMADKGLEIRVKSLFPEFGKLNVNYKDLSRTEKAIYESYVDDGDEVRRRKPTFRNKSGEELRDLFRDRPHTGQIGSKYKDGVRLFMFCRSSRKYPCLMIMKDHNDSVALNKDGSVWSQPALALSRWGIPYDRRNGSTPSGIYTMDSVMPVADKQKSFGKFRRIILNFIPYSKDEVKYKSILPESAHDKKWWRQSVTGRDIGRNLFRIHGTGNINRNPFSSYYPLFPTSGCVAQRENTYKGITYKDQRKLLDQLMDSLGLDAVFKNETKIKGLFYVIEINNKKFPVTLSEIKSILDI